MKKLKILTVIAALCLPNMLMAQEAETGIKGGLNLSTLSVDGSDDSNLKAGFHAGVYSKIPMSSYFAIQPELMYSGKGVKVNYDESAVASGESQFNLHYIDLPVLLVFNLSEDFSIQAGPYVSYLIGANTETDASFFGADIDSEDELDRDHFQSLDYGFSAGLGFDLNPLLFGFRYNIGLQQVAKDDDVSYDLLGDAKNSVIQLFVGLKF